MSGRHPVVLSLSTSVSIQALNVASGVILARVLGPTDRGELAAVLLWPSFLATLGGIGIGEALTYHTARATAPIGVAVATGLVMAIGESLVMILVGAIVVPIVLAQQSTETIAAAYLFLLFIPLNLLTLAFMSVLNGLQRFASYQACRLVVVSCTVAGLGALALSNELTVRSAVAVYLVANVITGAIAWFLVTNGSEFELRPSTSMAKQLLRYGIQSHLGAVSSTLNERLDQLIISIFIAPARLGVYVVAVTLAAPVNIIGTSVAMVALPYVAHLRDDVQRADVARRLVSLTLAFSAFSAVPLIVFAPTLVQFFFGSAYREAADVARILMVAAVVFSTGRALGAILKATGRPLDVGTGELVAVGVTVAGLAVLLPALGITGAAIASLLAYSASLIWMTRRATLVLEVSAARLLVPDRNELARLVDMLNVLGPRRHGP